MSRLHQLTDVTPRAGAFVMATGVVASALWLDDQAALAHVLAGACAAGWVLLALLFVERLLAETGRWWHDSAQLGALTAISGTTVFASVLDLVLGWRTLPLVLTAVALVLWVLGVARILSTLPPEVPSGLIFLLTVTTQGLALMSGELAVRLGWRWLVPAGLALWVLGILLYLFVEVHDFDFTRIRTGPGDHWVFGGAVAITVLAGARLILAAQHLHVLGGLQVRLRVADTVIWVIGMAILGLLVWAELAHPRLRYHQLRWACAFPVGMYAAATFTAAKALGLPWMNRYFASWWVWVAVAVWVVVFAGLLRRIAGSS